jgi:hypothetical protein
MPVGRVRWDDASNSQNESYIKGLIRRKIVRSDTYVLLIGSDTQEGVLSLLLLRTKALCSCRSLPASLPLRSNRGGSTQRHRDSPRDFFLYDKTYTDLGYQLVGATAVLPPRLNAFADSSRPWWAKS